MQDPDKLLKEIEEALNGELPEKFAELKESIEEVYKSIGEKWLHIDPVQRKLAIIQRFCYDIIPREITTDWQRKIVNIIKGL